MNFTRVFHCRLLFRLFLCPLFPAPKAIHSAEFHSYIPFTSSISFISCLFHTLFPSTTHYGTHISFIFFHLQTLCRHNRGGLQRHSLQRNNMTEKTDNSNSVNELSLYRHRTVSGRRCRLRVLNPESHLCFRHAQLRQKKRRAEHLSCDLAGQLTQFTSAPAINSFLSHPLLLHPH